MSALRLTKGQGRAVFVSGGAIGPLGAIPVLLPASRLELAVFPKILFDVSSPMDWRGLIAAPFLGLEVNHIGRSSCVHTGGAGFCSLPQGVPASLFQIYQEAHNNLFKRFHSVLLSIEPHTNKHRCEEFSDVRKTFGELRTRGERHEAC